MSIAENKAIVERFNDAWNDGNFAAFDDLCAPSYVLHGVGDLQAFKAVVADLREASPDLHFTIEEMIAEGEKVAYRWNLRRTVEGKPVSASGITIVRIVDGRIVEDRFEASDAQPQT